MQIPFSLERVAGLDTVFPTSLYLSPFIYFKIYLPASFAIHMQTLLTVWNTSYSVEFCAFSHLQPKRIYVAFWIQNSTTRTYSPQCLGEVASLGVIGLQFTCNFWLQVTSVTWLRNQYTCSLPLRQSVFSCTGGNNNTSLKFTAHWPVV
jgi:hypothetical protein